MCTSRSACRNLFRLGCTACAIDLRRISRALRALQNGSARSTFGASRAHLSLSCFYYGRAGTWSSGSSFAPSALQLVNLRLSARLCGIPVILPFRVILYGIVTIQVGPVELRKSGSCVARWSTSPERGGSSCGRSPTVEKLRAGVHGSSRAFATFYKRRDWPAEVQRNRCVRATPLPLQCCQRSCWPKIKRLPQSRNRRRFRPGCNPIFRRSGHSISGGGSLINSSVSRGAGIALAAHCSIYLRNGHLASEVANMHTVYSNPRRNTRRSISRTRSDEKRRQLLRLRTLTGSEVPAFFLAA